MTREEILRAVEKIRWFHSIDLGDGIVTPGVKGMVPGRTGHQFMELELAALRLPPMDGKSVLDVGTRDGYYAFACERLGAREVTTIDDWASSKVWRDDGFRLAREVLGSRVVGRSQSLYDLDPRKEGFDVTLFLGIIYHLRYPMWGLQKVADVTRELLVLESHYDFQNPETDTVPTLRFLPGAELNNDPTNWWSPSALALKQMMAAVGFVRVDEVHRVDDRIVLHGRR